ncbi:unannotated protein [freshwater metagenome]|uniref:Unannotated protein n=1 Tax=freshwater metagenome TaxID=449393 RepID=A0A6J6BQY9_9ZZZZ
MSVNDKVCNFGTLNPASSKTISLSYTSMNLPLLDLPAVQMNCGGSNLFAFNSISFTVSETIAAVTPVPRIAVLRFSTKLSKSLFSDTWPVAESA